MRFLALQRIRSRRAVRFCQIPDDPASTFTSPIDRHCSASIRPAHVLAVFRSATVVRSVIQVVPISESYCRRYVPGSCTVGPSHAVFRYPGKRSSSRPCRIAYFRQRSWALTLRSFHPAYRCRVCFHTSGPTCRSPRIHLDAFCSRDRPSRSTDRYGSYASSPTRF